MSDPEKTILRFGDIELDYRDWPLLIIGFPPHEVGDKEYIEYLAYLEQHLWTRTRRYATIIDLGTFPRPSAYQRNLQGNFFNKNREALQKWNCCNAYVVTTPMIRAMLRAVYWIGPPPVQYKVFAHRKDAIAWARQCLD